MLIGESTESLMGKGETEASPPNWNAKEAHMKKRKLRPAVRHGNQKVLRDSDLSSSHYWQIDMRAVFQKMEVSITFSNVKTGYPSPSHQPILNSLCISLFSSISFSTHTLAHQISFSLAKNHITVDFASIDPRQSTWQLQGNNRQNDYNVSSSMAGLWN